jgi:hypothetical protein
MANMSRIIGTVGGPKLQPNAGKGDRRSSLSLRAPPNPEFRAMARSPRNEPMVALGAYAGMRTNHGCRIDLLVQQDFREAPGASAEEKKEAERSGDWCPAQELTSSTRPV